MPGCHGSSTATTPSRTAGSPTAVSKTGCATCGEGLRQTCSWERFCAFVGEPERRRVAADARIRVDGAFYDVDADLAGETVTVGWGLFDHEPFVEFRQRRFGPYL